MSADREWKPEGETGDEGVEPSAYEELEPFPAQGSEEGVTRGLGGQGGRGGEKSQQDLWRRFAWIGLIIATTGVAWALVLSSILIDRSGDRTAELIALFEESQERREAALGQIPQSQKERRAALEAQRQQTRTLQAQAGAAKANQTEQQAAARRALADSALANSRARQADAQAALAQAQANRANAEPPSLSISLERQQIDLLAKLQKSIQELRQAIKDLRPNRPGGPRP